MKKKCPDYITNLISQVIGNPMRDFKMGPWNFDNKSKLEKQLNEEAERFAKATEEEAKLGGIRVLCRDSKGDILYEKDWQSDVPFPVYRTTITGTFAERKKQYLDMVKGAMGEFFPDIFDGNKK